MAESSNNIADIYISPLKGYNAFSGHFSADRNSSGKRFFSDDIMLSLLLKQNIGKEFKNKKCYRSDGSENVLYYGVSAKKKACRKAVVRNRIKRLFRVSFNDIIAKVSTSDIHSKDLAITDNLALIKHWHSVLLIWNTKIDHPGKIDLETVNVQVDFLIKKALKYTANLNQEN